ncbi:zinc-dependent alcohol dehydrogenase family protein [Marinobacterium mangrovicola]|uniref:Propanol-preferring alcohol dehydrogenase n=1 Tax=Marinobacterium mangrovicola TaxID=1476959 RepID=A0A4R1GV80_9GAMM|nr:zinc-dependent alcohol dehydrogenase family protein [Marinobacterium mangrovicola]TCK08232.1 propanol-preferring alcohol dehydrogenase [Marinobacterium mangrovicola]
MSVKAAGSQSTNTMKAMVLDAPGMALQQKRLPIPVPGPNQVRVRVSACGVCRTDLHVVDGDLPDIPSGIVPGHEVVGYIDQLGDGVSGFSKGERVGIPWLGHTCGVCPYCTSNQENLCDAPSFTGYTLNGGYAEYCVADAHYVFSLPEQYDDLHAAPLLCAGLIGYRSWAMVQDARHLGLYGFGAAAHVIAQVAIARGAKVYAFSRPGDSQAQAFAQELGACWVGDSDCLPPQALDAAIIFAPVGALVPQALRAVRKGATVVCAGIHMSEIPAFPYSILWEERQVRSVANLTRADGEAFMALAQDIAIETSVTRYDLVDANRALSDLREGRLSGAAVLVP